MTKISFKKAQELAAQKEWQLYRCADYYQQEEVEGKYNRYRYYRKTMVKALLIYGRDETESRQF